MGREGGERKGGERGEREAGEGNLIVTSLVVTIVRTLIHRVCCDNNICECAPFAKIILIANICDIRYDVRRDSVCCGAWLQRLPSCIVHISTVVLWVDLLHWLGWSCFCDSNCFS